MLGDQSKSSQRMLLHCSGCFPPPFASHPKSPNPRNPGPLKTVGNCCQISIGPHLTRKFPLRCPRSGMGVSSWRRSVVSWTGGRAWRKLVFASVEDKLRALGRRQTSKHMNLWSLPKLGWDLKTRDICIRSEGQRVFSSSWFWAILKSILGECAL